MFDVQKKVPVPKMQTSNRQGRNRKYPFKDMKEGDMFFVPGKTRNTMSTHVSDTGRKLGVKFTTRLCYMRQTIEGWVPAEPDEKGAVLGIGVWRTD